MEFFVGDIVIVNTDHSAYDTSNGNWGTMKGIPKGAEVTISRVSTNKVMGRVADETPYLSPGYPSAAGKVFWFEKELVTPIDPNAPRPRQTGEVPEGGIAPDHPGLMWLWEDAEKVAKQQNYCSEYDTLTAKLGIPGRERNFTVKHMIGSLEATVTVKARSQKLAEELVANAATAK